MNAELKNPPRVHRLQTSRSLTALGKPDPTGGRYGAGLIPGVSLCSRGEALGHYSWIDSVMLGQIVDQCNANPKLIKSRFAHPDMCDDGTGKALGTIENASLQGDQAIGDLHLYQTAHNAPDGDLAGYVLSLAVEDPTNFGLSIVFEHDWEAEELFEDENTQEIQLKDDKGTVAATEVQFVSPDPLNTENLPHARIKKLWAADVVDDPAANPAGLFHRKSDLLTDGTALLDYATGRTSTPPRLTAFSIAPERVREFLTRYLAASGLSLHGKDESMKKLKKMDSENPEEDPKPEENPEDQPADEKPTDKPEENDDDPEDPNKDEEDDPQEEDPKKDEPMSAANKLKKFVARFGAENGSKWTIEGISYETALERHCDQLTADLTDANQRLQALGQSGTDPVKFSHPPGKGASGSGGTSSQSANKLQEVCGESLSKVAAAIKLPTPSSN